MMPSGCKRARSNGRGCLSVTGTHRIAADAIIARWVRDPRPRPRRYHGLTNCSRLTSAATLAGLAVLTGCGVGAPAYRASAVGTVPAAAPTTVRVPAALVTTPVTAPKAPAPPASAFTPVRLRIGRLGMDAPIVAVGLLPTGDLDVPENPGVIGWWAAGARPGGAKGSVVLDGHVDSATYGLGVFAVLRSAHVGDVVEVASSDGGTRRYTVTARREYAKSSLPAAEVFSQDVAERLVLVTCGGRFDRATRHYDDNIVVYAVPA
jgi:hypothetical protein